MGMRSIGKRKIDAVQEAMGALSDNRFVRVGEVPPVFEDVALCEVQVLYP